MNQFREKNGRFIKRYKLNRKRKASKIQENLKKKQKTSEENVNTQENCKESNVCDGLRLVDIKNLGKNLKCSDCHELLDFEKVIKEKRWGLHSAFTIDCDKCKKENTVNFGTISKSKNGKYYDINTTAVLGAVHSGIGCAALNKIFAYLDILNITKDTYKRYENLVGESIEKVAKETCKEAAEEERFLVVKNIEKICEKL